ncbi:predicted protein, partial [Nematostella vectensis]
LWLCLAENKVNDLDWQKTVKFCFNERSNPDDDELGSQIVKDLHRISCARFYVRYVLMFTYDSVALYRRTSIVLVARGSVDLRRTSCAWFYVGYVLVFTDDPVALCRRTSIVLVAQGSMSVTSLCLLMILSLCIVGPPSYWLRVVLWRLEDVETSDEFYGKMGLLIQEIAVGNLIDCRSIMQAVYSLAPFPLPGLAALREQYTYNIHPFSDSQEKAPRSLGHASSDEEEDDADLDNVGCLGVLLPFSEFSPPSPAKSSSDGETPSRRSSDIAEASLACLPPILTVHCRTVVRHPQGTSRRIK